MGPVGWCARKRVGLATSGPGGLPPQSWRAQSNADFPVTPHRGGAETEYDGPSASPLRKIVNDDFFAEGFEDLFHEFDVGGMCLVIVLRFFVGEDEVERDLVGFVHDVPMAGDHPTD